MAATTSFSAVLWQLKLINKLIRKIRILLQLKQLVILIYTPELKEIFYSKKGISDIKQVSLNTYIDPALSLLKIISFEEKNIFIKELFNKLGGEEPQYTISLKVKKDEGYYVLFGGSNCSIHYLKKILGEELLQNFITTLKQNKLNKQKDKYLDILNSCSEIWQVALENENTDMVFNEINNKIKAMTLAQNAGFFLLDENSQYLVLQEPAFGINEKEVTTFGFPVTENNIITNVYKHHKSFYNNQAAQDLTFLGCLSSFLKVENVLAVPLLHGNHCMGVYCLLNLPSGFDYDTQMLIRQMMSQIELIIENVLKIKKLHNLEMELRNFYKQEKEDSTKYKYLTHIHQKFTGILIKESGFEEIINRIARHLSMPIVIFDYLNMKRISSDIGKEKTENFQLDSLADYFKRVSLDPEFYSLKPFRETLSLKDAGETVVVTMIRVKDENVGVFIIFEDTRKLTQLQMQAHEQVVHTCSLEFIKHKMVLEVEQKLKDDFINTLIYWNDYKEMDIINMAANFGYDFSRPYLTAVLCLNSVEFSKNELHFFKEKKFILRKLNDALKKILTSKGEMIFFKGEDVIILTPHPSENDPSQGQKETRLFFSKVQRVVFEALGAKVNIGVGSPAMELKEIKQSYHEARAAVDFLLQTGKQGILFFSELGFYQLFADQVERKRLVDIASSLLEKLIISDSSKGTSYLISLERYFYRDGNIRAASEDLHVHINTLRNRLQTLKDTFDIDLSVEKCKFNTYFAIKTLYYLRPELFGPHLPAKSNE